MSPTNRRRNNSNRDSLELKKIAELIEGEVVGDGRVRITGYAGIKEAGRGDITFLANSKYLPYLERSQAEAVIISRGVSVAYKNFIRVQNPSLSFAKVASLFSAPEKQRCMGVHPSAVIEKNVSLGKRVSIGPHVVIESDVVIGDDVIIQANTFVGYGSTIEDKAKIYPNVSIREKSQIGKRVIIHSGAVIGSDGFGYETINGSHVKIPQTGSVVIEDDVEIGANSCIDRGRFDKTLIKKGTKIDNLVQIAHNVVVGSHCLIVSQVGISGSSELGDHVVVAGQAGIVGHIHLGHGAIVGAQAGVSKSVAERETVLGSPAKPLAEQKKLFALMARLPRLFEEVSRIKKTLPVASMETKQK